MSGGQITLNSTDVDPSSGQTSGTWASLGTFGADITSITYTRGSVNAFGGLALCAIEVDGVIILDPIECNTGATFAGNTVIGDWDEISASGEGFTLRSRGQLLQQLKSTTTETSAYVLQKGTTAKVTFTPDGAATFEGAISANAGIDFSGAQTNLAGMTSELLDAYEEGTFTPEFSFSTGQVGSFTYTNRSASYTKIGRLVTVNIMFLCSGIPTAGTDLQCTLPFAPADTLAGTTSDHVGSCIAYYAAATGGSYAIITAGTTYAHIIEQGVDSDGGGGYDSMDFDDIESTFSIRATMSYCTA
jgi:hypothetical protein